MSQLNARAEYSLDAGHRGVTPLCDRKQLGWILADWLLKLSLSSVGLYSV
jgi:hypothetical protein